MLVGLGGLTWFTMLTYELTSIVFFFFSRDTQTPTILTNVEELVAACRLRVVNYMHQSHQHAATCTTHREMQQFSKMLIHSKKPLRHRHNLVIL